MYGLVLMAAVASGTEMPGYHPPINYPAYAGYWGGRQDYWVGKGHDAGCCKYVIYSPYRILLPTTDITKPLLHKGFPPIEGIPLIETLPPPPGQPTFPPDLPPGEQAPPIDLPPSSLVPPGDLPPVGSRLPVHGQFLPATF